MISLSDPTQEIEDGKITGSWLLSFNNSDIVTIIEKLYDVFQNMVTDSLRDNTPIAVREYKQHMDELEKAKT